MCWQKAIYILVQWNGRWKWLSCGMRRIYGQKWRILPRSVGETFELPQSTSEFRSWRLQARRTHIFSPPHISLPTVNQDCILYSSIKIHEASTGNSCYVERNHTCVINLLECRLGLHMKRSWLQVADSVTSGTPILLYFITKGSMGGWTARRAAWRTKVHPAVFG